MVPAIKLCQSHFLGESEGEEEEEEEGITLVPPGDTFRLERLPEAVKRIRVKRAADFASDGIFDRVFYDYHSCELFNVFGKKGKGG